MDAWIKNESIFVGKGQGCLTGPVDLFLSDTMKEWNNICDAESDCNILLKNNIEGWNSPH